MSEQTKPRELREIQLEYSNVCARVGHAQLQIKQLNKDTAILLEQLERLNFESIAAQSQAQADAAQKALGASKEESK